MKKSILMLAAAGLFFASCSKKDVSGTNQSPKLVINGQSQSSFSVSVPSIPAGTFNITSYGASTGSSDNTTSIQAAINAAYSAGGGTVVVPSGTFLCGPIALKDSVALQLSTGATLKLLPYGTYPGSGGTAALPPFIKLDGLTNVMVTGSGTIEGQGAAWWSAYNASKASGSAISRPAIIGFQSANTVESPASPFKMRQMSILGLVKTATVPLFRALLSIRHLLRLILMALIPGQPILILPIATSAAAMII